MKLEIVSEKDNPLLKRKEVEVKILQEASTPSRESLKKQVSRDMKVPEERIAIYHIRQPFGRKESIAEVRVYTTKEDLERVEQKYTLERGKPKPKGEEAAAPAEEKKQEGAPKEEKPAEGGVPKVPEGVEESEAPSEQKPAEEAPAEKKPEGEGQ